MIEPPTEHPPQPSPVPSAGPKVALALGVAVAVVAAGTVFVLRSGARAPQMDERVPATAGAYIEVNLRPGAEQRDAIDQILSRLPAEQRASVESGLDQMLDGAFSSLNLSWQDDVKQWVGPRVVVSFPAFTPASIFAGPQPVVLVSVSDEGAARASLQRAMTTTGGAFEIEDGIAFIAPTQQILSTYRADAERAPLADDPSFAAERAKHGDVLAFAWLNAGALAQLAPGFAGQPGAGTVTFALRAEPTAIVLEGGSSQTGQGEGGVPSLLGRTSATLLGALTFFDIGSAIESAFDPAMLAVIPGAADVLDVLDRIRLDVERDVAPWLKGEVSIIVGGFSGLIPDVGVLIEATDERALDRFATKLRAAAPRIGNLVDARVRVTGDERSLQLRVEDMNVVVMKRARGRVAFATSERYSDELLQGSADALADDAVYRRAVGDADGTTFQIFVRLDRIQQLLSLGLSASDRAAYEQSGAPLLGLFESAAITATADGRFRMVITVAQ